MSLIPGTREAGDDLYVGTIDGSVYAVQVSTQGGFRQGATRRLYRLNPSDQFVGYNHGRTLIAVARDLSALSRIEIVLNWTELLSHSK